MISTIARSPTGISGFGKTEVYGSSRRPRPPAKMTALTPSSHQLPRPLPVNEPECSEGTSKSDRWDVTS